MDFKIADIDIEVSEYAYLGIWAIRACGSEGQLASVVWVASIFFSILLHELGHALAFQSLGIDSEIKLYGLFGFAEPKNPEDEERLSQCIW